MSVVLIAEREVGFVVEWLRWLLARVAELVALRTYYFKEWSC
jgi:hypothetical protein